MARVETRPPSLRDLICARITKGNEASLHHISWRRLSVRQTLAQLDSDEEARRDPFTGCF